VLATCLGIPVVGQRYSGWSETPFLYGYDAQRAAISNVDILQFWVKARKAGLKLPFQMLSPAAVAGSHGRVAADDQDPHAFGTVHRGYHLHSVAYASALRDLTHRRGIKVHAAAKVEAKRRDDCIEHIMLDGKHALEADLFIDASGAEAVLAAGQASDQWQGWEQYLPVDQLMLSSAPPLNPLPPFADIRAVPEGWVGLFPLANRTAVVGAFSSEFADDSVAADQMAKAAGTSKLAPPVRRELKVGARKPWVGNCVAIGDSAVALPPLDLMQLHFAHVGVTNLIAWFPSDSEGMPEAETYNAIVGRYADNVRDFQIAHYRLNARTSGPLWERARSAAGPPSLEARLSLFAARALVPAFDEDTFDEGLWSAMMIGHGLIPAAYDLRVDEVSHEEMSGKLQRLMEVIDERLAEMPTVAEQISR
jgi:tryptophan halogenase